MVVQSILLGLVAVWGVLDYQLGTLYTFRPITIGPIVGLILGDFQTGITVGASLELLFMGAISVGAYIPPDVLIGGILGTAFAITTGAGLETAVTLAMPIALIALSISNFIAALTPTFLKFADDAATKGDSKTIKKVHWLMGAIGALEKFLLVFFAYYLGVDAVESVLGSIPQVIIDGMAVAAGMLPTLGFAMLMRMILTKKIVPYYFLGFILTAYLGMPVLGVAILGIIIVAEKFGFLSGAKEAIVGASNEEVDDDDF
ncbi:fructoselysine and glucoselysine-specific PTS system IIC component [Breznakia sp. PF5-3]|uniref:PTS mannose/fructose/sorbose/N-acetylgalactosamine transporter subunit IIC n=1 Tax=unclassified Breznakia TaxID=2623764 RepID=UPI0024061E3F|nr:MULTISPECIES: PTS sugar transporter subunit IIC [unclassified Breznakia]MDL2276241.1 PTS sugar transporter subunit IIC [Breznakia sp. OttesenSCG-928-G09]MDF9824899.1 fructoselysine and glucoselysine-specific PTS system IIC component [Breznakia sp. PM6-1]MDF9835602.1 fructoselysine and glucoselysine-specific PTS system IIC component [Breznakia sp. PF5-3]MDF9837982.1 fructoselysine and glucoselysine-specific PTS system IIC component [Breznakia sp. PFB2-8]MDF9859971.1 fructoselysine and glucos